MKKLKVAICLIAGALALGLMLDAAQRIFIW